jgi:urea transport system permease protein
MKTLETNAGFLKKYPITTIALFLLLLSLPFYLSDFRLALIGKFVTYAMVAVGLDLLWGYLGILSLGHGVFFSIGGYAMAMYLKLQSEPLPDFMNWSGLTDLPWFWKPFGNFGFTVFIIIFLPAVFAFIVGYPAFRSGIKGVYFSILTQALALALSIFFIGQQPFTGGTNGITNFQTIFGLSLFTRQSKVTIYIVSVLMLILIFIFARWIVGTKTGKIMIAIRDGENRLKYLGYNPLWFKLMIYSLSASIAGIAGALFVPQAGIISPSSIGIQPSVEMAIWVAIGGRGTITGAIFGAFLISLAKTFLSENFPDFWWYFFGSILIVTVLIFPKGLNGISEEITTRIRTLFSGKKASGKA